MVHPIVINELIVLLANSFIGEVNTDDMDVIGNFFAALGAMIIFNSSYISRFTLEQPIEKDNEDDKQDEIDLIKESIEKLRKEIKKQDIWLNG